MNKKLLSLVLALVMVFSVFTTLFAAEEETTEATETAPVTEEYIEFLKEHKIIQGDAKGDLMLDKEIDRASFAAILVRTDDKEATAVAVKSLGSRFKDMTPAHWGNGYANVASEQGWMKGNEKGEFMPSKTISYAEIATTLVRFLGTDDAGYLYPSSYIAKAFELGLFEGVRDIEDYAQPAIRKDIFRMIYNAISKEDFGRYAVYKMIVLENNRVAPLKANEIKAEILTVVQVPNKVSERTRVGKAGEQFVFNLEGLKLNTEYMLGKVANFTVDEKGKLVKVVIDESYEYPVATIWPSAKEIASTAGTFKVRVDERYFDNTDDRLYRTYVAEDRGSADYHYVDFNKKYEDRELYARLTVKDGMVVFIDAFNFSDIAPVKEVARDGQDVFYYNDARNGAVDKMNAARTRVIGFTAEKGFYPMAAKDIKANDVIHWNGKLTVVRQDAVVQGKLEKTTAYGWGEVAFIGEEMYPLNSDFNTPEYFRSVYAYDDKNYRRTVGREVIEGMRGDDVTALLDINGGIQLISSGRTFTDRVAMINRVASAYGMRYYAPNKGKGFELKDTLDSEYYVRENMGYYYTNANKLDEFSSFDLVYVVADGDNIDLTARIEDSYDYQGKFKKAAFEKDYHRFLTVDTVDYRYSEDTDIFVLATLKDDDGEFDGYRYVPMTLAEVIAFNKGNKDLKAIVYSEKEYKALVENKFGRHTFNRFPGRDDFARIIIFTDAFTPEADLLGIEYGKILNVTNFPGALKAAQVTLLTKNGPETFDVTNANDFLLKENINKIVSFRRFKESEEGKNQAKFLKLETPDPVCAQIVAIDAYTITVQTVEGGAEDVYYIDPSCTIYGRGEVGGFVAIYRINKTTKYAEVLDFVHKCDKLPAADVKPLAVKVRALHKAKGDDVYSDTTYMSIISLVDDRARLEVNNGEKTEQSITAVVSYKDNAGVNVAKEEITKTIPAESKAYFELNLSNIGDNKDGKIEVVLKDKDGNEIKKVTYPTDPTKPTESKDSLVVDFKVVGLAFNTEVQVKLDGETKFKVQDPSEPIVISYKDFDKLKYVVEHGETVTLDGLTVEVAFTVDGKMYPEKSIGTNFTLLPNAVRELDIELPATLEQGVEAKNGFMVVRLFHEGELVLEEEYKVILDPKPMHKLEYVVTLDGTEVATEPDSDPVLIENPSTDKLKLIVKNVGKYAITISDAYLYLKDVKTPIDELELPVPQTIEPNTTKEFDLPVDKLVAGDNGLFTVQFYDELDRFDMELYQKTVKVRAKNKEAKLLKASIGEYKVGEIKEDPAICEIIVPNATNITADLDKDSLKVEASLGATVNVTYTAPNFTVTVKSEDGSVTKTYTIKAENAKIDGKATKFEWVNGKQSIKAEVSGDEAVLVVKFFDTLGKPMDIAFDASHVSLAVKDATDIVASFDTPVVDNIGLGTYTVVIKKSSTGKIGHTVTLEIDATGLNPDIPKKAYKVTIVQ